MIADTVLLNDLERTNHALNSLMCHEIAATEAYEFAIVSSRVYPEYQYCLTSHHKRAAQLADCLSIGENISANDNELDVPFSHLLNHESCSTYRTQLIATLKSGEADLLRRYRSLISQIDLDLSNLLSHELIPKQVQTFQQMSLLFGNGQRSQSFLGHWF